jgi:hypothetical protein
MFRKKLNHRNSTLALTVGVKNLRRRVLDHFPAVNKLALPLGRLRAPFSRKIIQRGAAYSALDHPISIKHREPKRHPVNVVSKRFASSQCHRHMTLVFFGQNVSFSKLLFDGLNALRPKRPLHSDLLRCHSRPISISRRNDSYHKPFRGVVVECFQLLVKNPNQVNARNLGFGHALLPAPKEISMEPTAAHLAMVVT